MHSTIEIRIKGHYPGNQLSPMAEHSFSLDGVHCRCIESFLQSLKVKDFFRAGKNMPSIGERGHKKSRQAVGLADYAQTVVARGMHLFQFR